MTRRSLCSGHTSSKATSPHRCFFFLPLNLGGLGMGSAVQRHAAAPWRAMAVGHSHIDGNHSVTRHRHTFQRSTTTQRSTCSTSNHTLTTDEQAGFPLQTTWHCPSPKRHTKEASHLNSTTFPQATSESLLTNAPVDRAVLLSQSTSHTGAHLMQLKTAVSVLL